MFKLDDFLYLLFHFVYSVLLKVVLAQLLVGQHSLQLTPRFSYPIEIPKGTVGAVARAANPCYVQYKLLSQELS